MCVGQLEREKSFDRQVGCFFCFFWRPTRCFEGYDRWRQALCTPRRRSQEGFGIIAKLMFPIYGQFVHSQCSPARRGGQIILSDKRQTKYTHVLRGTSKYGGAGPPSAQFTVENNRWGVRKKWQPLQLTSLCPTEPSHNAICTPRTGSILCK